MADLFENGLDRDTYRAIKKMNREELNSFLKKYRETALKEIKDNYFKIKIDENGKCVEMNRDMFKLIHSELIQQVQCIEHNLKIIYATIRNGDFSENYESISKMNLGKIVKELGCVDTKIMCRFLSRISAQTRRGKRRWAVAQQVFSTQYA